MDGIWFLAAAAAMALANIYVVLRMNRFADFQTVLFRVSMLTGWVLLASLVVGFAVEPARLHLIDERPVLKPSFTVEGS